MAKTELHWILLLALFSMSAAGAAEDEPEVSVRLNGDTYVLDMRVSVDAEPDQVFEIIEDYERWSELNPSVESSERIASPTPNAVRVRSVTRGCVLVFCTTVVQVQDIFHAGSTELLAETVPELSDLSGGIAHWRLEQRTGGTEVLLHATLTPDFWIPPLIGRWAVQRRLSEATIETASNLQRLAQERSGAVVEKPASSSGIAGGEGR